MKFVVRLICIFTFVFISNTSLADSFYVGGQVSKGDIDIGIPMSFENIDLSGIVGEKINNHLAMELRLGRTIKNDSLFGGEIFVKSSVSVLSKIGAEISGNLYPYMSIGFTRVTFEGRGFGVREVDSDMGISYGVGMSADIERNSKINLEFMNYFDKDGFSYDALSIGFLKGF